MSPPSAYDFSQDAFSAAANKSGMTPAEMGAKTEQEMKDRVLAESKAKPGELIVGGQTGKVTTGGIDTPVTFQAYTNPVMPELAKPPGRAPEGSVWNPAIQAFQDPTTGRYAYYENPDTREGLRFSLTPPPGMGGSGTAASSFEGGTMGGGADVSGIPEYRRADTSALDAEIAALSKGRAEADIQAELDRNIENIVREFDYNLRAKMNEVENAKAEEFSSLAAVGANPLSSGAKSVANRSEDLMNKFRSNLEQQRDAKIEAARLSAAGQKTDAANRRLGYLMEERGRLEGQAKEDYTTRRQKYEDTVNSLNRAAQIAKENKAWSAQERDDARANIKDMFGMFGSAAFDGVSDDDMRALEKAAGLPAGSIKKGVLTLKEAEQAAKNPEKNLKFVTASKYQQAGFFDPTTGEFVPVAGARASATGGGGSGSGGGAGSVPKGFASAAQTQLTNLAAGRSSWGAAWNALKASYPTVPNSVIDSYLGKGTWDQPGAYEASLRTQQQFRGTRDPLDDLISGAVYEEPSGGGGPSASDAEDELDALIGELRLNL